MVFRITAAATDYLERLAAELDVPRSRYEEATRRYHSVGDWLGREESSLKDFSPDVYVQGSFRLGTPIRPVNDAEHYDIDLVCELSFNKRHVSQRELKEMLGKEILLYAEAHNMKDVSEGRRCWTLEYAEGAQFHLDALPCIPDGEGRRIALESMSLTSDWINSSIAITDTDSRTFNVKSEHWPHSNPKGFTEWFRSRMKVIFNERRLQFATEAYANVEDVPSYEVKTPLQQAIQILKRHRDLQFKENTDDKPISVILTTLAAKSYRNQPSVAEALAGILSDMDSHIELRGSIYWIENPTDPAENFADRWIMYPERRVAFYAWLTKAREDFAEIAERVNPQLLLESASSSFGAEIAKRAASSSHRTTSAVTKIWGSTVTLFTAAHKQVAPWRVASSGRVKIARVRKVQNGFRDSVIHSGGQPLPKFVSLEFTAKTDVALPYAVYWQVVNTGDEAARVRQLRGDFNAGVVIKGDIVHNESTAYSGAHSVECFIVKNNTLVARSGAFIVNIQ
jgi:hypothetical protein